jgi:anti-anti-sigma regulatory factor
MLKITVVEDPRRRRVIVEGKLIAPWAAELTSAYQTARTDLQDRELIVDLRNLTAIGPAGEGVLLQLMRDKVKLLCGVYMKEVLKQLGLKTRDSLRDATAEYSDSEPPATQS